MQIKKIEKERRPREKAIEKGIESLSDEELLALILTSGVPGKNVVEISRHLLEGAGGFFGLFKCDKRTLSSFEGVSKVKALEIMALGEISRRSYRELLPRLVKPEAEDLFKIYAPSFALLEQETMILLLYDKRGRFNGERRLYAGTSDSLVVSHLEILKELLRGGAYYFYLLHNHPSGDPLPSQGEVEDTLRLKEEAEELSLHLLDHVVIAGNRYFSFANNSLFRKALS